MPALENPRHESFCQFYAVCGNASESWRKSGGVGENSDVHSSRLMVTGGIRERIAEIREAAADASELSKRGLMTWLGKVIAGKEAVTTVQLRAAEILGRMSGWNEADRPAPPSATAEEKAIRLFASPAATKIVIDLLLAEIGAEGLQAAIVTRGANLPRDFQNQTPPAA